MKTIKRNKVIKRCILVWIALASNLVFFGACNKWLDVRPSTETTEEDQFSSEQGYIDALIGLYQKMTSTASYGKDLTYGALDVLAQLYENKASVNDTYGYLARYDYSRVLSGDDFFWKTQYNIISQANYILRYIDDNKSLFRNQNFNLVKGETLAVRAMVHFDLLRLYAPAKVALTSTAQKTIPYMTQFTVTPREAGTFQETIDLIVKDLKDAETLLSVNEEIDQIAENANTTSLELFTMFRQNRLNYWAVKGLLARVYLYNNDKEEAFKYANEVIDSKKFFFINPSTLNANPNVVTSNIIFSTEHIFSIYHSGLKALSDQLFKVESGVVGASDYFTTSAKLHDYYEDAVAGYGNDVRGIATNRRWEGFDDNTVYTTKYYVGNTNVNVNQRLIPILRLPEMYYIAAESAGTIGEALDYLNVVRTNRLISEELDPAIINTDELLENEIFKEYRKEFYAEGQLWYYYKRKNYLTIPYSVGGTMNNDKYVFPIPSGEIDFGLN